MVWIRTSDRLIDVHWLRIRKHFNKFINCKLFYEHTGFLWYCVLVAYYRGYLCVWEYRKFCFNFYNTLTLYRSRYNFFYFNFLSERIFFVSFATKFSLSISHLFRNVLSLRRNRNVGRYIYNQESKKNSLYRTLNNNGFRLKIYRAMQSIVWRFSIHRILCCVR